MGYYSGITVGPVFAKLFAMMIESRLGWAEEHGVKARGQAGFEKNYHTTDNTFVLRSLIDKQKQSRQRRGSGKMFCCFVDPECQEGLLIQYQGQCCGRCLQTWESVEGYSHVQRSSQCMHRPGTVQLSEPQQASLKFSDACWGEAGMSSQSHCVWTVY